MHALKHWTGAAIVLAALALPSDQRKLSSNPGRRGR